MNETLLFERFDMEKTRIKLEVSVDLDPVPGTFHTKESAEDTVGRILKEMIPHYNPVVNLSSNQKLS